MPRTSLTAQAAARLRDMVLEQQLAPGARIPEQALCAQLGISRTPLREALKVLATEGLVALTPNRGAVVSDPSAAEIEALLQVMAALEALAGELAACHASGAQQRRVAALHHRMVSAYRAGDRLAYFKLNQQIHLAIVASAGNPVLRQVHEQLNARAYRVLYLSSAMRERWPRAVDDHQRMVELLERRDAPALGALMRRHRLAAWDNLRAQLEDPSPR